MRIWEDLKKIGRFGWNFLDFKLNKHNFEEYDNRKSNSLQIEEPQETE